MRQLRRAAVLSALVLGAGLLGTSSASAHGCTQFSMGGENSVCNTSGANVSDFVSYGSCGTGCVVIRSSPTVWTYGETSVTVQDTQILTVDVPDETVNLGSFCYTTPGGSC